MIFLLRRIELVYWLGGTDFGYRLIVFRIGFPLGKDCRCGVVALRFFILEILMNLWMPLKVFSTSGFIKVAETTKMGWQYKDVCSADGAVLFARLRQDYPILFIDSGVSYFYENPRAFAFADGNGQLSYQFSLRKDFADSLVNVSTSVFLSPCNVDDGSEWVLSDYQIFAMAIVLLFLFFMGFSQGRK
jgi:hypothetical protein